MRSRIERQLHLSLGRYIPEIRSVKVKIRKVPDTPAPTFECGVAIRTSWKETVTLQHIDGDVIACATHTIALAGRWMHRMIALREGKRGQGFGIHLVRAGG